MKGHARNLMSERVIALSARTQLADVLRMFAEDSVSGAPVVDDDDRVIGFVSETDLLGALLREEHEGVSAADVMTTPPIVVDEFLPTDDVMSLLRERQIHHLPVVRQGQLVGIITPRDILRYFVQRFLPSPSSPA